MSESAWYDSDDGPAEGNTPPPPLVRRRSPLGVTLVVLVSLLILLSALAQVWTEVLWFDSVHYLSVFTTQVGAEVLLGVVGGIIPAALVWAGLHFGHRARPVYAPATPQQEALDRYREALEPIRRLATVSIPLLVGVVSGVAASQQWEAYLLWRNQQPFGANDPQFDTDIGFFVFSLPWLTFVVGFLTMAVILGAAAAAFTHYVYGGLQLADRGRGTTRFAFLHLAGLFAALALLRAAAYWLDRYGLSLSTSDLMTGVQYTDANAVLPTKAILAVASIMCALMFLSVIWTRSWRLPIIGTVLLVVVSVVVGGIFPALIQGLRVRPSEKSLEAPYLSRNIAATRTAYGLDAVQKTSYLATSAATPEKLRADAAAIPGIRTIDPNVVSPTFKQDQAARPYYSIADSLDVDRYTINGTVSDVVVAAREVDLDSVNANQRNWLNDHTVYTHGYGLVAAYGNRQSQGRPVYVESSIPAGKALGEYEPRIYFGERSPAYAVVGALAGATPREFDYLAESESQQVNNTYAGTGGVALDSFLKRLAYATKYREPNFLLSDAVNSSSRIMDYRTPKERVSKVAPWLTLDGNPYPSIVDGHLLWIVDAYTTSASYPNSRLASMQQSTTDSVTRSRRSVTALDQGQINYIRNSVKATVDAFDGSVNLYVWDDTDPVLKAWMSVFPGVVQPAENIAPSLMSHLRYPEDLFKVQRNLLSTYHVTDPDSFYSKQDFWRIPTDPTQDQRTSDQPAYYLSIAMPGQTTPEFSLTTTFMPQGTGEILTGFLAVDSNPGDERGAKRDGYGTLRLLELPPASPVNGPGKVQNEINGSNQPSKSNGTTTLSQFINLNKQGGSTLIFGNLLTLPMAGGVLNVEPIYVQASTGTSAFPIGRAIVVYFGGKLGWSDTLDGALNELFGGQVVAPTTPTTPTTPTGPTTGPTSGPTTGPTTPPAGSALQQAIADAQKAYDDGQTALKAGDFAAYGDAQKRLKAALDRIGTLTVGTSGSATTGG